MISLKRYFSQVSGEVAEWSIALDCKSSMLLRSGTEGSNPSLSE